MKIRQWASIDFFTSLSERVLYLTRLTIAVTASFFVGVSSAVTPPLAIGNQWVYAHHDSEASVSGMDDDMIAPAGTTQCSKTGTLMMTIMSAAVRHDSTFFSILYSDTGIMAACDNSGCAAPAGYKTTLTKNYLEVNDTLHALDSSGVLNWESYYILSYRSEPDTAWSSSSIQGTFSRKTTPMILRVGADSSPGVVKVTFDSYNEPLMGTRSWSDTVFWSDKFGMTSDRIHHSDNGSQFTGGGATFLFLSYTLVSFRNVPAVVFERSGRASPCTISPRILRKLVVMDGITKTGPSARSFSLTGRCLTNRIGRQISILAP